MPTQAIEWSALAQLGSTAIMAMLLVWLLTKGIPKLHEDERTAKVAAALASVEAMALVVAQTKERMELHRKDIHDERGRMHEERMVSMLQIQNLTNSLAAARRTDKPKGLHAAAE